MVGNQNHEWRAALVARHPGLFNTVIDGRTVAPGCPTCDDGWSGLVETAVARIAAAVDADPAARVTIEQIKEKFGALRLYWRGRDLSRNAEHAVEEAVALAEARSACTCEVCGAPGVLHDSAGWFATTCTDHARGVPVPVAPGFENVHIVRILAAGYPIASCRRYDRNTDSFVDVDPKTLGIEE